MPDWKSTCSRAYRVGGIASGKSTRKLSPELADSPGRNLRNCKIKKPDGPSRSRTCCARSQRLAPSSKRDFSSERGKNHEQPHAQSVASRHGQPDCRPWPADGLPINLPSNLAFVWIGDMAMVLYLPWLITLPILARSEPSWRNAPMPHFVHRLIAALSPALAILSPSRLFSQ